MNADDIIRTLGLVPLGFEGGFYKETYRQDGEVVAYGSKRSPSTAIFYMLTPDTCSLMHVLRGPEVYHFYLGDPVEMLMLEPSGRAQVLRLGHDLAGGARLQHVVPGAVWQGSRLEAGGAFALMGTTMAPGFDLADFRLGSRDELIAICPEESARITALTPARVRTERLELAAATKDLLHAELRGTDILGAGLNAEVALDWPPPLYDENALRWSLDRLERGPEQRGWWQWYFVRREPRTVIGAGGFKGPPDASGTVEIGYAIVSSCEGQGFGTEAAGALVARAFEDERVRRVVAETLTDGTASMRVLEKNGFVRVGEGSEPGTVRFSRERSA